MGEELCSIAAARMGNGAMVINHEMAAMDHPIASTPSSFTITFTFNLPPYVSPLYTAAITLLAITL
jgi:hypothetical protein